MSKGVSITRVGASRTFHAYIHDNSVIIIFNCTPSFTIFLLYEVRPQCRYVLPNLAPAYTRSTWHAGVLFMFISKQIGSVISERAYSVTETC